MPYEFGDIVLVPFPFTSLTASKQRPAVVVSQRHYNAQRPDVVLMAVTSQVRPVEGRLDTPLPSWASAGLLKPSVVKPVFATLEQALILRTLGRLHADDQTALRRTISAMLG